MTQNKDDTSLVQRDEVKKDSGQPLSFLFLSCNFGKSAVSFYHI